MRKWIARIILAVLFVALVIFLIVTGAWLDALILIGFIFGVVGGIVGFYWLITWAFDIK